MPDGNSVSSKSTDGAGGEQPLDLSTVSDAGDGDDDNGKRTFGNVVDADGWRHVGAGWWQRGDERERRPGKSGKSKRARASGGPRIDVGGTERREQTPKGGSKATLALASVERILHSIHFGISIALKAPEFVLTSEEAEAYAKAVASVARHYDMGASAKTLDWFNLATTMGSIYGVRVMGIAARRKDDRRGRQRSAPNGHDPEGAAPEATGDGIDWSSMTGRAGPLQ